MWWEWWALPSEQSNGSNLEIEIKKDVENKPNDLKGLKRENGRFLLVVENFLLGEMIFLNQIIYVLVTWMLEDPKLGWIY